MARDSRADAGREGFRTTRWSLVGRAASGSPEARQALESLCTAYWYPLYVFARRRGLDAHAAQDGVQGFFARLLEKQELAAADPARGRFRSFLRTALAHHLANERDRERAAKRGGGRAHLSIDALEAERRYAGERALSAAPEREFERQWARALLARAGAALEAEWQSAGRSELLGRLRPFLTEEASSAEQARIAREVGKSENAVRIALHRLRRRFGELVRLEVAETVADPAEVEAELDELLAALGNGPNPADP